MKNKERLYLVVGTVAVIGLVVFFTSPWPTSAPSSEYAPPASPTAPSSPTTSTSGKTPQASLPATSITVTSPLSSDEWVIGENHLIAWSKATGIPGSIMLANAATGATVGWITPTTDVHQTSYRWNTRDVFLTAVGSQKKDLQTGRYIIKIDFPRNPPLKIQSAPFSVIYASQEKYETFIVSLRGYVFTPIALTVTQGDRVVFSNSDDVTHKFVPSSYGNIFTLAPGESGTLDTTTLAPASYGYYSTAYPTMKFTLTVIAK